VHAMVAAARTAFRAALESDLNTAAGLAAMFDLVTAGNIAIDARRMSASDAALVREAIEEFDRVLGVVSLRREEDETVPDELVREIEQQIEARNAARQRRDFATADQIRRSLADRGILLEDNPTGTRWKRK
jgi:cysteinyl-tRNA synthetase